MTNGGFHLLHWGITMTATSMSSVNVWKEVATERERSARYMTFLSVALGFALLATFSYSYASASRYSGLCAQIEAATHPAKNVREMTARLAANHCS
jgi:hypothetical protein